MDEELLVCETCLEKCVPFYVRNNINDPVICIGCRMSKFSKENPGVHSKTPLGEVYEKFKDYLDKTYDFTMVTGDVIYEDDVEIGKLAREYDYDMAMKMIESATITTMAKQQSNNTNPLKLQLQSKYMNLGVCCVDNTMIKMHEIKPSMEGKKIKFNTVINGLSDKKTYYTLAVFECKRCHAVKKETPDELYQTFVPRCEDCRLDMVLDKKESKTEATRRVILEEPMEEAINSTQQRYIGIVTGENVHSVSTGQRRKVTGVFRSIVKETKNKALGENDIIIDVKELECIDRIREIMPTKEEIEMYKTMSVNPDFLDKLIYSFTDKIGLYDERLAILLSRVRGCTTPIVKRDDIHLLFMGNPSVAKSDMLKEIHELTPGSYSTSGENVSKVGLRGGIQQTDGYPIFVAGTMSMANGSLLVIDELDKIPKEDLGALHTGMEQQYIEYDKVIHTKTPSDTTVIAAANPKTGYYDNEMNLQQNFNIPYTLQTRFDLIFFIKSIEDENTIKRISEQATNTNYKSEPFLSREKLSAYLNYCSRLTPEFTDEAGKIIQNFWVKAKMHSLKLRNGEGIKIEPRHLHGLIRLAFAFAKLQLHEKVTTQDAESAIGLFKRSLMTLGQDVETGELHQGVLTPTPKENKQSTWITIVNDLSKKSPDGIIEPIDLIDAMIKSGKFDEYNAKEWITKDAFKGTTIINTWNGKYKLSK